MDMKKKSWLRKSLSLVTSLLLITLGILALFSKDNFASILGIISGIALILIGVLTILYAVIIKRMILGTGRLIFQGILSTLLGILLLVVQEASIYLVSTFLSIYLLIRGISKISNSVTLKTFKVTSWWITLVLGILYTILGLALFIFNNVTNEIVTILIGTFFIISGALNIIELFDYLKREKREEQIISQVNKSIKNDVDHIDIDFTKKD